MRPSIAPRAMARRGDAERSASASSRSTSSHIGPVGAADAARVSVAVAVHFQLAAVRGAMPKQLYGRGQKSSRQRAVADDERGWLTLIATLPEAELHTRVLAAFSDERAPPGLAAELRDALAASLIEYAAERNADCDEAWISLLLALVADFALSLADDAEADEDAPAAERAGAEELLRCLKRHNVLCTEPPPPPPLTVGSAVVAVLAEDGEWHEAVVVETSQATASLPRVVVRFKEWAKVQETARKDVVALSEVEADDADAECGEGECEMCGRSLKLTFHHLVPKQTHSRYLGNRLPNGVAAAATSQGLEPQASREFLNRYGVMVCGFCHSTIHRFAPNAVLAERFGTLDALLAAPEIQRFVAFAGRLKCC